MTMEDMNACAECGFTTNNFAEFTEHIEQHESEQHRAPSDELANQQLLLCSREELIVEAAVHSTKLVRFCDVKMTMEDMNACAECGFTTNNFAEFTEHIEQHESEQHRAPSDELANQQLLLCSREELIVEAAVHSTKLVRFCDVKMTMEDMNACAECGFTTNNFAEFTEHIEQHESEQHRAPSDELANQQEWSEDVDDSPNLSSPEQSPLASGVLSLSLSPVSGSNAPVKASKIVHSCPHCNFTTFMSQHMKSHLEWSEDVDDSPNLSSPEQSPLASGVLSLSLSPVSGSNAPVKASKIVHSCPHCNFTTFMSQHMKSHLEWSEDVDDSPNLSSPEQSPLASGVLSLSLSPVSGSNAPVKASKIVHSCPHCNFTTFMSQHMKSHLEAHERHQGQMYQCDICHMQFSQKANMHRHRMRHSGVKPYQCRYCLKKFFRKDQMQEHSMTHIKTGADFDCPVALCEQQFSQHAGLRTHLDEAHTIAPSSPASCKRCSLLFANSRRLLLHYQTKHDEGDTSGVVVPSASANTAKTENAPITTAPSAKKRRATVPQNNLSVAQNISAAIHQQLKLIQQDSLVMNAEKNSFYHEYEQNPYTVSNEELLMSLSNSAIPAIFTDVKAEAAMQLWTREGNGTGSDNTEEQSHSPSVDSGSSAVDGETGEKEQQDVKAEAAMQLWTREGNGTGSDNTEEQSHSPSVDSGSSAVDGETGEKEQQAYLADRSKGSEREVQECLHCGVIFLDQTLYLLHKGLHSDSDPWKCNLCGHACGDKYMFTTHVISSDHSC
ncbi:Ikaros DNA-binding protein [Toxocara canis]|uniref:Ikaros DNA-binding protein n=1 Tax=Toxocara canis TaxID=6265 RepID=A0A0B2VTP6_TOXCA|nr:Ikaros DNA-binding protein [Toxocara canis]